MKGLQRVVWSEGMLVSPQHMQQADIYHERVLDCRLGAATSLPWGITAVQVDAGALTADQLVVSRFAGVLPDGLPLDFKAGDPEAPAARPVGANFPPALPALEVFLAVPKEREGVPSVAGEMPADGKAAAGKGAIRTRFRSASRKIVDMTGEAADLTMAFAQRNLTVLFGNESLDDYDSIKIAEIVRDAGGALLVSDAYIPPVLTIAASPFLMGAVQRLLALMAAKQRQLAAERAQRDSASIEFSANDVTRYLQLSALNATIPFLFHAGRNGEVSPRELYLFLIQSAGQLATFSAEADPSAFPPFVFTDLRSTFEELFALLTGLLRANLREQCVRVPMEIHEGIHVGNLNDERIVKCQQFVLGAVSSIPMDQLGRELAGRAKIASWTQLPFLMRSAVRGVPLQVTHRPPPEIPVRPGVVYFLMDTSIDHWRHVLAERKVAIYAPPPFDASQVKIELYGIPSKG
ncbi:MAG: type VI secretion system baseplate subunit TssK [Deltaproteobacteria bacterium]|nr:type VI secretion system baseplate subunit TssK [Deltaproteobacteria bacterium]